MKKREFLYDDGENFIIWSETDSTVELICVYGDRVFYYLPNSLIDNVLFTQLMERLNIAEVDRNNIRNIVMDMYDEWNKNKNIK